MLKRMRNPECGRRKVPGASGWVIAALLACAATLHAQAPASPYLPLDDPAYAYIDALQARGRLTRLDVLERPYTVRGIREALGTPQPGDSRFVRGAVDALERALRRYDPDTLATGDARAMVALTAGGTGQTSGRRELMLADDSTAAGYPFVAGRLMLGTPRVVAAVRLTLDERLKHDPEFSGSKARSEVGRAEDAYLSAQWRYGELFLGRLSRNWGGGPSTLDGLQLGHYAYSYEHVYARIGVPALHISTVLARLDNQRIGTGDSVAQRYLAAHRLAWRWRGWQGAFTETMLFGGIGRSFEPAYANPLNFYDLSQYNEVGDGNVSFGAELARRTRRAGIVSAQLLLDDFQIDRCSPACKEPASYGVAFTAEGIPLTGEQRGFASYTRVTNLAYRAPLPWERYAAYGIGIGRGFSDYDEARLGLDLALLPGAPIRAYAAWRRQGEGDYRLPFPPTTAYPTTPAFLAGVVMKTMRIGLSKAAELGALRGTADVGINRVTNADHVAGRTRTGVEGRVVLTIEPRWARVGWWLREE